MRLTSRKNENSSIIKRQIKILKLLSEPPKMLLLCKYTFCTIYWLPFRHFCQTFKPPTSTTPSRILCDGGIRGAPSDVWSFMWTTRGQETLATGATRRGLILGSLCRGRSGSGKGRGGHADLRAWCGIPSDWLEGLDVKTSLGPNYTKTFFYCGISRSIDLMNESML